MAEFFAELKRRQMFRVAAAYAVVAWLLLQIVNNVAPVLDLPPWVSRAFLLALVIGLPIALLFVWMRDLAPADAAAPRAGVSKIDYVLIGALAAVLLFMGYQQLAPPSGATRQAGVEAARDAAASPRTGISLAVLPFTNLSSDPEQEFFSDGMTEEITAALAKVPDLRVVGRTSAFEFKGQNRDLRAIGQALSATHLIEGSVRKAGERVRITAQLINAEDGTHLWSENYDRELTDIFAIQEDIARAIAGSLRMPLGLSPGENLIANRNIDVDLYQRFLQLRAQVRALNNQTIRAQVLPGLEELVARDPNFAPAWSYLSRLYILIQLPVDFQIWNRPVEETRRRWQSAFEKSERAAREAIRLDPKQAFAYSNLARWVEPNRKNWAVAEDLHRKALDLDPFDSEVLYQYGDFLFLTGRVKEALRVYQQSLALDPQASTPENRVAIALLADGQENAVIAMLGNRPPRSGVTRSQLAQAYAAVGQFDKAADTMLLALGGNTDRRATEEAARLIRNGPTKVGDPSALSGWHWYVDFVYGYVGAPERLLDYPERAIQAGESVFVAWFSRNYAPARKTERFKRLVREAGLVDYWKARGWPEFCRPVGADDFACE